MLPSTRGTSDPSQVGAKRHSGSCRVPDTLCTLAHTAKLLGSIIVEVQPKIFADLWFPAALADQRKWGAPFLKTSPDTRYPAAYSAQGKASQPPMASHSAQAALRPFPALQMTKILVSHRLPFMLPHPFERMRAWLWGRQRIPGGCGIVYSPPRWGSLCVSADALSNAKIPADRKGMGGVGMPR